MSETVPDGPDELINGMGGGAPTESETRERIEKEKKIEAYKAAYSPIVTQREGLRRNFISDLILKLVAGGQMDEAGLVSYAENIGTEIEKAELDPWGLNTELFRQSIEIEGITLEDLE